jgi:hypothetical protein
MVHCSYLVMDCVMTDLHQLIKSAKKPLEGQFIQFFTYQMLVRFNKSTRKDAIANRPSED